VGRLVPRRAVCTGCGRTHVLLPASVLLRRADAVTVIGAALLARVSGCGHRRAADRVGRPPSTVRGWLRRIGQVEGCLRFDRRLTGGQQLVEGGGRHGFLLVDGRAAE